MTVSLDASIDEFDDVLILDVPLDAAPGDLFVLESEIVELRRLPRYRHVPNEERTVGVRRARYGTARASHESGTELLGVTMAFVRSDTSAPADPFSGGGGGVALVEDPVNVWEADTPVVSGYRINAGGRVQQAGDDGTTGSEQPDFSDVAHTSDGTTGWDPVGNVGGIPNALFAPVAQSIAERQVFGLVQGVAPVDGSDPADVAAKVNEVILRLSDSGLMRAPD